jgi:hypothetical protein
MDSVPPLTAIRAFDAAARLGSFAKAAAELHVTHWAIGKQEAQVYRKRVRFRCSLESGADVEIGKTHDGSTTSRLFSRAFACPPD